MKKIFLSPHTKGFILSFSSAVFVSLIFIFSFLIRRTMDTPLFLFWWFAFASALMLLILIAKRKEGGSYFSNIKKNKLFFIYIAISEGICSATFFHLIKFVNPAILAFFTSLAPFFVVIIAFFYIKESLNKFELAGGFISITGVIMITYVSPDIGSGYFILAMAMVSLFAFNNVLIRKKVQDVPPLLITIIRTFSLFLLFSVFLSLQGGLRLPSVKEGLLLMAGALSGPFLSIFSLFSALKYMKAANVSLIKNSQPFLVIIFSTLFLGSTISFEEFLGGLIAVAGITILLSEKKLGILFKRFSRAGKRTAVIFLLVGASAYLLHPGDGARTGEKEHMPEGLFREASLPSQEVIMDTGAMLKQIEQVLEYFREYREIDSQAVGPGLFSALGVTLQDVETTLIFCRNILKEDLENGTKPRLRDPAFLKKHFRVVRWYPEAEAPAEQELIRLTKYAVFTIAGREKRNHIFKYALYGLPADETGMSLEEARKHKDKLSRFKYTKQMVLAGAYKKGGARPLIWVRRHGLEKALMQGTICVKDKQNNKRYFNVCRGNDIPYDPGIRNPKAQERYWYFAEVKEPKGYGMDSASMVTIYPDVAFAGDVVKLGLGKIMVLKGRKMRLGVLADTGGAFTHGLDRLDYYAGVFETDEGFRKKERTLPEFAEVYILIKRQPTRISNIKQKF